MKNKYIWIILGVLAVVLVVVLVLNKNRTAPASKNTSPSGQSQPEAKNEVKSVPIETVKTTALPQEFPSDIPLETGAEVTLNYNATNAQGQYQASREFISKKTIAENYALYQQVLKSKGWTIISTQEDASAGSLIFAEKSNYSLNIRIYTDAQKKVRVSINNVVKK